jgi:hypothetical protein
LAVHPRKMKIFYTPTPNTHTHIHTHSLTHSLTHAYANTYVHRQSPKAHQETCAENGQHGAKMKAGFSAEEASCLGALFCTPISKAVGKAIEEKSDKYAAITHTGAAIIAKMAAKGGVAPRIFAYLRGEGRGLADKEVRLCVCAFVCLNARPPPPPPHPNRPCKRPRRCNNSLPATSPQCNISSMQHLLNATSPSLQHLPPCNISLPATSPHCNISSMQHLLNATSPQCNISLPPCVSSGGLGHY